MLEDYIKYLTRNQKYNESRVGYGFRSHLMLRLLLGVGCHVELQRNSHACHQMMQYMKRHVASKQMAAVRDKAAKKAEELCTSGQCAAALVLLQLTIYLGDLPSRALMAFLLINGREGVVKDPQKGFELAEEGARLGCPDCKGVVAFCLKGDIYSFSFIPNVDVDEDCALELARVSSENKSSYGQLVYGKFCLFGEGKQPEDIPQALVLLMSAAAQGLDEAQLSLGYIHDWGIGVPSDETKALQFYQLAVAQGNPDAMCRVASCHERGRGVAADVAEAIRWYRRAQAAGNPDAALALQRLRA